MLESKSITHQGLVRERNEDSLVNNESLGLWVIADGVGGNAHGDVASQLVVQTIERSVRQGADLGTALIKSNEVITSAVQRQPELVGMATTAVACHFHGHQFELAWVGDSRAYLIDSNGIYQLTRDHNRANQLLETGEIEADEFRDHPGQHELTQALGQMSLERIPKNLGELHEGDFLLLCTDGLTGVMTDEAIYKVVQESKTIDAAADVLLSEVLDGGAPDNVTFSLIQFCEETNKIKASDFKNVPQFTNNKLTIANNYRRPFDQNAYIKHCKKRPMLLALIIFSICFLLFFM